ncbi:SGNH/GDSL hydrolase family protein [Rhodococcus erythropolis]|uniref:SGNH/GDSL hydrolase family protein n=1 Tax=Rhodococcus erythropolis TaxID=1833 RepID=UPI0040416315
MAYVKQSWVNKPNLSTPMSAARLNHIEDGIEDAHGVPVTRSLTYCHGGQVPGAGLKTPSSGTWTQFGFRHVIKMPATTTRWRIRLRNYDTYFMANGTAPLTGTSIIVGEQVDPGSEGNSGNFRPGTAVTVVPGPFTVPNTSAFYESVWFTASDRQFVAGQTYVIGWGASSTAQQLSAATGEAFIFSTAADATNPGTSAPTPPVGTSTQGVPIDFQIEYETTTTMPAWLFIGDSIMEGYTGIVGTAAAAIRPYPSYNSYPHQWGRNTRALAHNIAQFASTSTQWATLSEDRWTRTNLGNAYFDGAVIGIGSNDCAAGLSLATYKANMATIVAKVRSTIGADKPIYLANIIGRTGVTAANKNAYNDWLSTLPFGVTGLIDFDSALTTPASTTLLGTISADAVHPNSTGQAAMARILGSAIDPSQSGVPGGALELGLSSGTAMAGNKLQVVTSLPTSGQIPGAWYGVKA